MERSWQPDRREIPHDHAAELVQPFLRLNFATVWVRDQERSRRFFVEQLGFQVIDTEVPEVGRWIVVTPPMGLPGLALVVPLEQSVEGIRIGRQRPSPSIQPFRTGGRHYARSS